MKRRDLLKKAATATVASAIGATAEANSAPASVAETMMGVPFEKRDVVRIGFIGLGGTGDDDSRKALLSSAAVHKALRDHLDADAAFDGGYDLALLNYPWVGEVHHADEDPTDDDT